MIRPKDQFGMVLVDMVGLANMKEKMFPTYLDADLLRCTEEEVFVDLGAGIGDVTKALSLSP